jgi:hypothetical protein
MKQVEVVEGYQWDAEAIRRDWTEKVLPHLPRNTIISAVFAENPAEEMYTYVHRPVINPILEGTVFEDILKNVPFELNRAVFIYIPEGMCLRHHNDPDNKYHISVIENGGSFYYDYNTRTGEHLPADGKLRRINSAHCHHTAVNGGCEARIHLVMTEYECDSIKPAQTFSSKLHFDYSQCNIMDQFTGKKDIASTIEQNFTMPLTQSFYRTKKVHKLHATNDGMSRTYSMEWTDKQKMIEAYDSDMFWQTQVVLDEFGIRLYYEIC